MGWCIGIVVGLYVWLFVFFRRGFFFIIFIIRVVYGGVKLIGKCEIWVVVGVIFWVSDWGIEFFFVVGVYGIISILVVCFIGFIIIIFIIGFVDVFGCFVVIFFYVIIVVRIEGIFIFIIFVIFIVFVIFVVFFYRN